MKINKEKRLCKTFALFTQKARGGRLGWVSARWRSQATERQARLFAGNNRRCLLGEKCESLIWLAFGTVFACSLLVVGWVALADGEVTTKFRIEGLSETIFSGDVEVGDCEVIDADGGTHNLVGMAVCALTNALDEVGVDAVYSYFSGLGLSVDKIGDDVGGSTALGWAWWSFWVNGDLANVGTDSYEVQAGDEILFAFGVDSTPLLVSIPDVIIASDPFNIEVTEAGYWENYMWHSNSAPAEGATLWVDGTLFSVGATGVVEVLIADAGQIEVWAESAGKVRSKRHTKQILAASEPTPSITPTSSISPTVSPSVSPSPTVVKEVTREAREQAARKALEYLRANQNTDGTIGGTVVSGWSAMAFGANGKKASDISLGNATLWDGLSLTSLDRATDVERQIMAVRAAGGDPRAWQGHNLVHDLKDFYTSGQFGEDTLINDDIFGVLALLAVNEPVNSIELRQGINNIVAWQEENGSWGNVDLSAAAIQALREYQARSGEVGVNQAIQKARDYLKDRQDDTGGFANNSASTAWAIQAILSLGEDPNNWINSREKTPWNAILDYQKDNGGISWKSSDAESTFMTAYAVPALLGVPWPIQTIDIDSNLVEENEAEVQSYTNPLLNIGDNGATSQQSKTPKIAGASTVADVPDSSEVTSDKTYSNITVNEEGASVINYEITNERENKSINKIDPRNSDRRFVFTLFGLVNMGLGVTVARLVMRI